MTKPIHKGKLFLSILFGGACGFISSLLINACLLEISLDGFFTTYFGVIFGICGSFMLYRARKELSDNNNIDPDNTFMKKEKNQFYLLASVIVLLSSILCFFLDTKWPNRVNFVFRIPIYVTIGTALCFTIIFGILDIVNFCLSYFQSQNALNIVESQDQIISILINCFTTGGIYGFIFSFLDIEDRLIYEIPNYFFFEERLCVPIGIVSGVIGGFVNEVLRHNVGRFQMVIDSKDDPFDEQI